MPELAEGPVRETSHEIVVVVGNKRHLHWVTRIMRSLSTSVRAHERLESSLDTECDLLFVDYDELSPPEVERVAELLARPRQRPRVLLMSGQPEIYRELFSRFGEFGPSNVLAKNGRVDPSELIITARKALRGDVFGLSKYFSWGTTETRHTVASSADSHELFRMVTQYVRELSINPRIASQFRTVVNELVTNALFNAPVDPDGTRRFMHLSRQIEVALEPDEKIGVALCCDGSRLGVSVTDPFGSLTQDLLVQCLARCFRHEADQVVFNRSGGAGIGLYMSLDFLSQFVVNIAPGDRTEFIGIVDISGNYKYFLQQSKSFNVFFQRAPGESPPIPKTKGTDGG